MHIGFVLQMTAWPNNWICFVEDTSPAIRHGFVLQKPRWEEYLEHTITKNIGFVLPMPAARPNWLRFPNSLFSSRSTSRCARTLVFRCGLITTVHSTVKARNASRPARTHKSPARDDMAKVWQARPLPASRANAYR